MKIKNNVLEDLIWMSMRYCVGRHTITATSHAEGIASIIGENPGILSKEQINRLVLDIRDEIISILRWEPRIEIIGSACGQDVYSEVLYNLHTAEDPNNTKFIYDAYYKTMREIRDFNDITKSKSRENIDCDYTDLIPWIKLANMLDTSLHKKIVCEWVDDSGRTIQDEEICFPYPARVRNNNGYRYFKAWAPIKTSMGGRLNVQCWIPEENIKQILDV